MISRWERTTLTRDGYRALFETYREVYAVLYPRRYERGRTRALISRDHEGVWLSLIDGDAAPIVWRRWWPWQQPGRLLSEANGLAWDWCQRGVGPDPYGRSGIDLVEGGAA